MTTEIDVRPAPVTISCTRGRDLSATVTITTPGVDVSGETLSGFVVNLAGETVASLTVTAQSATVLTVQLLDVPLVRGEYHFHVGLETADAELIAGPFVVSEPWEPGAESTTEIEVEVAIGASTAFVNQAIAAHAAAADPHPQYTTAAELSAAVSAHEADTTNVHGIADTSALATRSDLSVTQVQYVLPTGDDNNDGTTWARAKATLLAAAQALPATGGEIVFAGTLVGQQIISKGGISVRGLGRTSVIQVTTNTSALRVENCSRVRLSNFRVLGNGNAANTLQRGIQCINMTDSIITEVIAESLGYDGILLLSGCTDNLISNCLVRGTGDDGINIGGDAVAATSGNVVTGNTILNAANTGIHLSDGSDGSVVVGNTISGCTDGIDTRPGVDGNIISGNLAPDGIVLNSDDNVLRGNVGTITDNGLRNSREVDRDEDGWWHQRVAGFETLPRHIATSGATATGNGNMRLGYFTADRTMEVSNVRVGSGTTAAGATPTLVRVGLYEVASNGDLTLVASTANTTSMLAAQNTLYTTALSSPYTLTKGQRYALGLLVVTAATAPTVVGQFPGSGTSALPALAPRLTGFVSGQTDLPASVSAGSVADSTNLQWIGLTA